MTSIKTLDQLETRMAQVQRYLDQAAQQAQAASAKLIGSDGKPRFAPHVEAQERKAIAQNYAEAVSEFLTEAGDWHDQAQTHSLAAHGDPIALLDTGELQRAALLAPLVKEAVASMPLPDLAQRLEAIAVAGDMPTRLVYLRHSEQRAMAEQRPAGPDATVAGSGQSGRHEFTQAVDKLRAAAQHPKLVEAEALAAALHQAAATVEIAARRSDPRTQQRAAVAAGEVYKGF